MVIAVVGAVLGLVVAGFAGAATAAPPSPPHRFFGTVVDEDGQAVSGATVEVVYQDEVVATATTDSDGYYDVRVSADEIAQDEERTVAITIRDETKTFEWESGGSTEVDFTVERVTTPTTTTTTSGGGGGGGAPGGGGGGAPGSGGGDETTASDGGGTDTPTTSTTAKAVQDTSTTVTEDDVPPTTDTSESDATEPSEPEETTTPDDGEFLGVPGFGVLPALVALAAAALLAIRRRP